MHLHKFVLHENNHLCSLRQSLQSQSETKGLLVELFIWFNKILVNQTKNVFC